MKLRLLLTFVIGFLLISCSTSEIHNSYSLRHFAKDIEQPTLLRTDGYYLYIDSSRYATTKEVLYLYIRFYDTGRCVFGPLFSYPPISLLDPPDLHYRAQKTFFITKDNTFQLEVFINGYFGYEYYYGSIEDNAIYIDATQHVDRYSQKAYLSSPTKYIFIPVDFKYKNADW